MYEKLPRAFALTPEPGWGQPAAPHLGRKEQLPQRAVVVVPIELHPPPRGVHPSTVRFDVGKF